MYIFQQIAVTHGQLYPYLIHIIVILYLLLPILQLLLYLIMMQVVPMFILHKIMDKVGPKRPEPENSHGHKLLVLLMEQGLLFNPMELAGCGLECRNNFH